MDLLCTYFITQACVFFQCSLCRCFEFMESIYKSAACYAEVAMKYGHGWSSGGRIRLGFDAGIPASVSVARGFRDQVHEHFAQLLAL